MNLLAFKSKLVLNGDTQKSLAKKMHMTPATLSRKMTNKCEWLTSEVKTIVDIYHLTPEELFNIFFEEE